MSEFGVIFDMDGVLVDSNPVHRKSLHLFCKKHNRQISEQFLRERVYGRTNQEWIPEVFGDITVADTDRLADEKEKMFRDMFDPKSAVIPGLFAFLDQLYQSRIKLVVATSAPKENADFILDDLSIRHFFDAVLDSSHVVKGKPHPEIYLKAADAIGLPPQSCIVIEDSLSGVHAAIQAGAKVVGITSTHTREEMKNCDKVVNNFKELTAGSLAGLFSIDPG